MIFAFPLHRRYLPFTVHKEWVLLKHFVFIGLQDPLVVWEVREVLNHYFPDGCRVTNQEDGLEKLVHAYEGLLLESTVQRK